MKYETVIGLEIHAQLLTESKMFCSCSTKFGSEPNTNICPVCTGQPGTLPVTNKKAIALAIKTAIALNCAIEPKSVFARKNYFYPDLPKGYQVSQYDLPLSSKGYLEIEVDGEKRKIGITRVHLEEDAGKLVHKGADRIMGAKESLVDYNRTGVPLMEIVSEPDMRSPKEAAIFMQALAALLQYIETTDAKMEEGSLRCDANLSIRPMGEKKLGTKSEIKNMNSFKAVEKALTAEEKRHTELVEAGEKIIQETRFFDDNTGMTSGMRSKEDAHDYRYFPEPDLVPVEPSPEWVKEIRDSLGELPQARVLRLEKDFKLSSYEANLLVSNKSMADFFEESAKLHKDYKAIANWLIGPITACLKEHKMIITNSIITPKDLLYVLEWIDKKYITRMLAKDMIIKMTKIRKSDIINLEEKRNEIKAGNEKIKAGNAQISNKDELIMIIKEVLNSNPKPVEEYKAGKKTAIGFLVGQLMKATKGRANPKLANKLLKDELEGG